MPSGAVCTNQSIKVSTKLLDSAVNVVTPLIHSVDESLLLNNTYFEITVTGLARDHRYSSLIILVDGRGTSINEISANFSKYTVVLCILIFEYCFKLIS